ncbi:YhgE/Pip domain-containing protein [Eubacterium sp. 1001713B170207_170306_E7]|uniref:YhgE/Pip domain-containing protein n=1 Tax=Eubacterium sp. 1001713B170207_170306_E7 TaxID=2787097 RepID=UPI001896B898|nr:YhgE/Pip domain-containing protein [Eubacterium sp. 1001713B170207_170306_E7]
MEQQRSEKSFFKKWMPWIVILGVIIIPLMYSFFYLDAFWDPYSRLDTLPVAVVNQDKGAVIDGKSRNLGKEMCDKLEEDGTLKFVLTDEDDAVKGTEGSQYYALIRIPENFSSDIASAGTQNKREAEIYYSPNEKRNYLASQILSKAVLEVEKSTQASVDKELVAQLSGKLYEVPGQLETLQDGLGQLKDGADTLSDGTGTLADGTGTLLNGAADLNDGAAALAQGASALADGTSSLAQGAQSLQEGADTLANGTAALKNGTADLADGASALAGGTGALNQGAGDLAAGTGAFSSKVREYQQGEQKAKSGADQVAAGAASLSDGITQLSGGLNLLSQKVNSSMTALDSGVGQLQTGFSGYQDGVDQLISNSGQLVGGIVAAAQSDPDLLNNPYFKALYDQAAATDPDQTAALQAGGKAVGEGLDTLSAEIKEGQTALNDPQQGIPALIAGAQTAQAGSQNLADGTSSLQQGMDGLDAATGQLVGGADTLDSGANKVAAGASQADSGAQSLDAGAGRVNAAAGQVSDGAGALADGTAQAGAGVDQVNAGAQALDSGASALNSGTTTLVGGAQELGSGVVKLRDGSVQLKDGLQTAKTGVDDNLTEVRDQLKPLNGLDSYAADPVNVNTDAIDPVPNYGTAFAPYFLSLSLWVGALIIFFGIYLDADEKFVLLSRRSEKRVIRSFSYLAIGLMQAVLLAAVLQFGLGLQINHLLAFYLACCLVSMVFIAIVQFLVVFLKDVGKFLAIALLILQLTSCGGTFPMETVPKFFNILYPFMPMTYSVGLFKDAISGTGTMGVDQNSLVLIGILIVFMALTVLFTYFQNKAQARRTSQITEQS